MNDLIPSIKIIFCLTADEFDIEEVTTKMGVIPTGTRTKNSFPIQGLPHTEWSIEIKEENCQAVSSLFKRILVVLGGKVSQINAVCSDHNLKAIFVVVIHMKDGDSPEVVLPQEIISFAAAINAEIGFDLYCYE